MKPRVVLMIGLPGSGKSTLVSRYTPSGRNTFVLNLDTLKRRQREMKLYAKALEEAKNVVVDDANVTAQVRRLFIWPALQKGYLVIAIWVKTSVSTCLARRPERQAAVKTKSKQFEVPVLEEGFDQIIQVLGEDSSLGVVEGVVHLQKLLGNE